MALLALFLIAGPARAADKLPINIGVNVGGVNDYAVESSFVDAMKESRHSEIPDFVAVFGVDVQRGIERVVHQAGQLCHVIVVGLGGNDGPGLSTFTLIDIADRTVKNVAERRRRGWW
jgi:hypothetical protein